MFRSALAAFALLSSSHAGTFFVSPVGSDTNPGTFDRPWKTISYGVRTMASGDILNVRAGTYTNSATSGWKAGTSSAPTIVQAYNGETVLCKPYGNTEFFYFGVSSAHHIIVSGFKIDCSNASLSPPGIKITEGANNITITNCEIYNVPSSHGILISDGSGGSYSNKVINCVIHDISIRFDGGTDDHGIYLSGSVRDNIIDGNTIYNCTKGGQGPHAIHQFSGAGSTRNIYRNNTIFNCNRGIGLYSDSDTWVYNNLIYSNVVGIYLNYGSSSVRVFNNTLDRNQGGIIIENSAGGGHQIVNNLVTSTLKFGSIRAASGAGTTFFTNNLSCDNLTPNFSDETGRAVLSGNLFGNQYDAGFVNAGASDYHLLSSSSARGAGVSLASLFSTDRYGVPRPQGAWSIGAVEFTGGTPINNQPVVSSIGDVSILKNTATSQIGFTVSDVETAAGSLIVTGSSSVQSLVSNAGIQFGGSGNNRSVTITPQNGAVGVATITITVSDGVNSTLRTFQLTVTEPVVTNQGPNVSAGPNQTITLPLFATLQGAVTDDGLPSPPGVTTISWEKESGPGNVTFGNTASPTTTATFSAPGSYVLLLTATDGALTSDDSVSITVNPQPAVNTAPVVAAGPNQTVTLPSAASLNGVVSDDGLPSSPGTVTLSWSMVSGPATPSFANANAAATTVSFPAAGTYVLRLTANDGALNSSSDLTINVNPAQAGGSVVIPIEAEAGALVPPMTVRTDTNGAGLLNETSYVVSTSTDSGTAAYVIGIPTAGDYVIWCRTLPATPANDSFHVAVDGGTEEPYITSDGIPQAAWMWTRVNRRAPTPQFSVVTRVFNLAAGQHTIVFRSREPNTPLDKLIVTNDPNYVPSDLVGQPTNRPPTVTVGPDQSITLPATAALSASVNDDGLPSIPGATTKSWTKVSGPGTVTFGEPNAPGTTAAFTAAGTYVIRLSVSDGVLVVSDDLIVTVSPAPINIGPQVSAGVDQAITLPAAVTLSGVVSDDGLPTPPGALTVIWSKLSGPGTVLFGNATHPATTAAFTAPGTYVLRLTAGDGALTAGDALVVTVNPQPVVNVAPTVAAGPDQTIALPNSALLSGSVGDDGLPIPPGITSSSWSKLSGPGTVTFANATAPSTTAAFSTPGNYVLRLTATDGALTTTDDLSVKVDPQPPTNARPVVSAGVDQTVVYPSSVLLNGTATDDGVPANPGTLSVSWTRISGPGNASFANPGAPSTSVAFSTAGSYLLRLTADDGDLSASDDVVVTVEQPSPGVFANIILEAELSSITSPMVVGSETDYSDADPAIPLTQTTYVTSSTPEAGSVLFTFNISTPGDYQIWCRVLALSAGTDSFYVSVDGGPEITYVASDGTPVAAWKWTRVNRRVAATSFSVTPRNFTFSSGTHTVRFRSREDNTFLDKIRITNDPTFVPPGTTAPAIGPRISDMSFSENGMVISWPTVPGRAYRVYYKPDIAATQWTDLTGDISATDTSMSVVDLDSTASSTRIYSVYAVP